MPSNGSVRLCRMVASKGWKLALKILKALWEVWQLFPTTWKTAVGGFVAGLVAAIVAAIGDEPPVRILIYSVSALTVGAIATVALIRLTDELRHRREAKERAARVWLPDGAIKEIHDILDSNRPSFAIRGDVARFRNKWLTVTIEIRDINIYTWEVIVEGSRPDAMMPGFLMYFDSSYADFFSVQPLKTVITVNGKTNGFGYAVYTLRECELVSPLPPTQPQG